jgi:AcrR family transcriptional regulator
MSDKAGQILKAAECLFAEGRFHEVTLDEICKKAGVGKGTVYRYFEGKEDLLYQVILSGMDDLVESVREVAEQGRDPAEGLREVARRITQFYGRRAALFQLMHGEQLRCPNRRKAVWRKWRRKSDRMVEIIGDFIVNGTQEGLYHSAFPPRAAARLLLSMLRTGRRNSSEMPDGRHWPEAIVEFFEHGLRAPEAMGSG